MSQQCSSFTSLKPVFCGFEFLRLPAVRPHLFSLDLVLDLGYFDLHGVDLLVLDQRDRGGLTVLDGLEGQISQRDVPLTVILLPLSVGGQEVCLLIKYDTIFTCHVCFVSS